MLLDPTQSEAIAYDTVAFPTAPVVQTHPVRLAAMARLHGIVAADPAAARVLEIACGDGMNLLAMAVAAPEASFTGFDLSPAAIARGQQRASAAGLANLALEVRDLLDASESPDGQFDYIIAHGLYAWVPDPVREAVFPLIGRLLAPNGIAFVSYNTLPGGYFRMAVRDLMRHFVPANADAATMLKTAREVLTEFAPAQPDDGPAMAAYRHHASLTLQQPDALLFHDELGREYHPQLHSEVCAAAERAGLVFLADSGRGRFDDGFLPENVAAERDVHAQIVRLAQERDFMKLRYFRRSLFARAEAEPRRTLEPGAARGLWASSRCTREGDGWRGNEGGEFAVKDPLLATALDHLAEARPGRLAVAELGLDDDRLRSLLHLFDLGAIELHAGVAPFTTIPPERPAVSPLVRAMLGEGLDVVGTLDHSVLRVDDPALRRFLGGLDGSHDAEGMEALATDSGFAEPAQWRAALDIALRKALIMPAPSAG
jgi:SAM-dependent methyltransferase